MGLLPDANGKIDFLDTFPFPENVDMGYYLFMILIDAIIMCRKCLRLYLLLE